MNELIFEEVKRLLGLMEEYEILKSGEIFWRVNKDNKIEFYANCSDTFFWACAEGEPIQNSEDIDLLEKSAKDCINNCNDTGNEIYDAIEAEKYISDLYSSRQRKMRPQGAVYENIPKSLWFLFDECGPKREAGFGNPVDRDEL